MAYRATLHITTGYSPFNLLRGQEIVLPNKGDIETKIPTEIQNVDQVQRRENLKSSLMKEYKDVMFNNRKAHRRTNLIAIKQLRRGKLRSMIRFTCFALLGSQEGAINLDRSGKDLLLLCKKCLI
jgi:hypothetical protein